MKASLRQNRTVAGVLRALFLLALLATSACHRSDTADESSGGPATPEQAVQIIDLTKFPLPSNAPATPNRSLAALTYEMEGGNVKSVFEFQREKLKQDGWKEATTDSSITDQSATATFRKKGFILSVSVFSASPSKVMVSLINHGNVNYDRLPRPPGMKPIYVGAVSAIYVSDAPVADTKLAVQKGLMDSGWQAYGQAGDSAWFKQNAIRLNATVSAAPAQGNKATLSYSSELMSADLPAHTQADDVRYAESTRELTYDTTAPKDDVVAFYKKTLAAQQWHSTMEKTVDVDDRPTMIFRNPTKDMLTLSFDSEREGRLPVSLQFQSAAEIADLEQRMKAKFSASPH